MSLSTRNRSTHFRITEMRRTSLSEFILNANNHVTYTLRELNACKQLSGEASHLHEDSVVHTSLVAIRREVPVQARHTQPVLFGCSQDTGNVVHITKAADRVVVEIANASNKDRSYISSCTGSDSDGGSSSLVSSCARAHSSMWLTRTGVLTTLEMNVSTCFSSSLFDTKKPWSRLPFAL